MALYGVLRLSYLFFYLRLRTTPEEVGYNYSRILSESIIGAIVLVLLVSLAFAAALVPLYALFLGARGFVHKAPGHGRALLLRSALRRSMVVILVRAVAAAVVVVLFGLPIIAWWQGGLARSGQTVRNVYFVGVPYLPVLPVQAVPAEVNWVAGVSSEQFDISSRRCLMYLGRADGIAVLYDVRTGESIRVPASDILLSYRFTFFVDQSCRTG